MGRTLEQEITVVGGMVVVWGMAMGVFLLMLLVGWMAEIREKRDGS